jgi:hypothetical protein
LWDAIALVDPGTEQIEEALSKIPGEPSHREKLLECLSSRNAAASFTVGWIMCLHFSGRTDLIPRFAKMYAETTEGDEENVDGGITARQ